MIVIHSANIYWIYTICLYIIEQARQSPAFVEFVIGINIWMGGLCLTPTKYFRKHTTVTHVYAVGISQNWTAWNLSYSRKTLLHQDYEKM